MANTETYDMDFYHCGACGQFVSPEDGYHGDAEAEPPRIYCDGDCCMQAEPEFFDLD